jgi:hypothetical protein
VTRTVEDQAMDMKPAGPAIRADVAVVSMDGELLLIVRGTHNAENRRLVAEAYAALVHTGTPPERIELLWS